MEAVKTDSSLTDIRFKLKYMINALFMHDYWVINPIFKDLYMSWHALAIELLSTQEVGRAWKFKHKLE